MNIEDMVLPSIKNIPPSGIRKYFDIVNEMDGVISLGVGEPDFVTPWNIREAGIYSLEKGHTHYTSNSGLKELRAEISRYLNRRYGLDYDPENQIIITVGGSEAIDIALRALVGPKDEVIIPEPSFVAYKGCTLFAGAVPKVVNLRAEDDFKLTPQLLKQAITPKTKVLIMPYPNNPTGAVMTHEDIAAIVDVLKDEDMIVVSDEIYSELTYCGNHVSIASFPEIKDRTILISGFSKSYAMTGWRLGYVCAHPILIDAMKKIHQYAIMCSPTTSQYAAIEALKNSSDDVLYMVSEYNRRRRVMLHGFRKIGLDCFEAQGAFYVFPCIKSTGMSSEEFCEKLLREEKVLVIPGNAFGACGEGYIRACYASSMENIMKAIRRIGNFVSKHCSKQAD